MLVDRARLVAAGGYDERYRYAQDFELWLRLLLAGWRTVVIGEALVDRRLHARAVSSARSGRQEAFAVRAAAQHYAALLRRPVRGALVRALRTAINHRPSNLPPPLACDAARLARGLAAAIETTLGPQRVDIGPIVEIARALERSAELGAPGWARRVGRRGQAPRALRGYDRMVRGASAPWLARYNRGSLLVSLGRSGEAADEFEALQRSAPGTALAAGAGFHLARLALVRGALAEARAHLAACLERIPDHRAARALFDELTGRRLQEIA